MKHVRIVCAVLHAVGVLAALACNATTAFAKEIHSFSGSFGSASSTPANPYPLSAPSEAAVDKFTHDVYVSDPGHYRVEKFDSSGHFLLMFGKAVNKTKVEQAGSSEAEQNVCTVASGDTCQSGVSGMGPGAFEIPKYIAVDNTPGGEGKVYVADLGSHANEAQVLTVAATGGEYTLTFNGETTEPIQYNAEAQTIASALWNLKQIGGHGVNVEGPPGGPYTIEFSNQLENTNIPQIECNASKLVGGGCSVATERQGFNAARLIRFSEDGVLDVLWGTNGDLLLGETYPFQEVRGLAVDPTGEVKVAVRLTLGLNGSVPGGALFSITSKGLVASVVPTVKAGPSGISIDSQNDLFVDLGSVWELQLSNGPSTLSEVSHNVFVQGLGFDRSVDDLYAASGLGEGSIDRYRFVGTSQVLGSDGSVCVFGGVGHGCDATESFGQGHLTGVQGVAVDEASHAVFAVNPVSGDVSVFARVIVPDVVTGQESEVQATSATLNGTVNPDGLPVTECRFEYVSADQYQREAANPYAAGQTVPCAETVETVGSGNAPVDVQADINGLEPGKFYHFRLVAVNANGTSAGRDVELAPPGPPIVCSESAEAITPVGVTLTGGANPHSVSTTYHFDYITEEAFRADGESFGAGTSSTAESAPVGADYQCHAVSSAIGGLKPETAYRYRLVVSNASGTTFGASQSFTTLPAALVDGPWAAEVSSTGAKLDARIDPLGVVTTYGIEYGPSTDYGNVIRGTLSPGSEYVSVSGELSSLSPGTVYHYRIITENAYGTTQTSDRTFRTQPLVSESLLLDGRKWEQVSPVEKHGANILFEANAEDVQAASDGDGVAYLASNPVTVGAHTMEEFNMAIAKRERSGWAAVEPMPSKSLPEGPTAADELLGIEFPPPFLSSDLSSALIEPTPFVKPLSAEATERTLYVFDRASGTYLPLVTPSDVLPGVKFGGPSTSTRMEFRGATPDLNHVIFVTPYALTPGALTPEDLPICEANELCKGEENLYEWAKGAGLQLVNLLPDGKATVWAKLGRGANESYGVHAVSDDGRWIVWTHQESEKASSLYLRDMTVSKSYRVGGPEAAFEAMSKDGSRVFYVEGGDLYELSTVNGKRSQVAVTAAHGAGESTAGVQDAILGSSEDGSVVYVVAKGVLTGSQQNGFGASAVAGQQNLYLLHDSDSGWSATFIATLSADDEHDWSSRDESGDQLLSQITSHVSPDGRWVLFMSEKSLTGYDNHDAVSGVPDEELFLYDARSGRLACVSCNPTGERPHGMLDEGTNRTLVDQAGAWLGHWVAGSVPGWRTVKSGFPMYDPRVLFDSGRVFFQSSDALVPQDTNGREDVYEYEPTGVGTCTENGPTFNSGTGGCLGLVSGGSSPQESVFYDASEPPGEPANAGNDVFFVTGARLAWTDIDEAGDLYDARVDGGFPEPVEPPPCEGDACQGTASSPIDETPASLTYQGPGNVSAPVKPHCRKGFRLKHDHCVKIVKHKQHRAHHHHGRNARKKSRGRHHGHGEHTK